MKNLSKTKVVIIALLMFAFVTTLVLLGINTLQNQAAQDSSASTQNRCIGIYPEDNPLCATFNTNDFPCDYVYTLPARSRCCTFRANVYSGVCTQREIQSTVMRNVCAGFNCDAGNPNSISCVASNETVSAVFCKNNPSYSGGGSTSGGTTPPVIPEDPGTGGGGSTSTPTCTPVPPTVAKLVSPRNKTEIKESEVVIKWEKNGNFGKECKDNGKPDRFILKYAVVGKNQSCPTIGSKYKGRQLTEKQPNLKNYSVEISDLENNKKYCWFIRKKNGETKSETKVRSFVTNFTTNETNEAGGEDLKVIEGSTSIEEVDNAE